MLEMNYTEQQLTAAVVSEGLRPILASSKLGASASVLSLIERCWDADPESRPSFDDIVVELDAIFENSNNREEMAVVQPSVTPEHSDVTNSRSFHKSINWFTQGKYSSKEASIMPESFFRVSVDSSADSCAYSPVVTWGSFAMCGRRETMEDRHFLMPNLFDEKDIHAFGIFDGHRGMYLLSNFDDVPLIPI